MRSIEQMVRQEVNCCLSSLISTLASGDARPGSADLAALCDQALELVSPVPDYEEAAVQAGWFESKPGWYRNTGHGRLRQARNWQELCEGEEFAGDGAIDPIDSEVYEHWAVSQWLAEKLIAHGEKVDTDFAALNVWARQTTGQQISADGVIGRIYAAMMAA